MAYYQDLERCSYIDADEDFSLDLTAVEWLEVVHPYQRGLDFTAVGWLEAAHPYQRGSVPPELVGRLFELLESVWDPLRFRGWHTCDLCDLECRELRNAAGRVVDVGVTNLFVPKQGDVGLFVAPSLILHYVLDHGYMPPAEFQAAVMACPGTNSSAYFRRVGRTIPTTSLWRDYTPGYWVSMGAAIAGEAGLVSRSRSGSYFDIFGEGRVVSMAPGGPAEAPKWFATLYLEPLSVLGERLENEGKTEDVRAIRAWLRHVERLGRDAPPTAWTSIDPLPGR